MGAYAAVLGLALPYLVVRTFLESISKRADRFALVSLVERIAEAYEGWNAQRDCRKLLPRDERELHLLRITRIACVGGRIPAG